MKIIQFSTYFRLANFLVYWTLRNAVRFPHVTALPFISPSDVFTILLSFQADDITALLDTFLSS